MPTPTRLALPGARRPAPVVRASVPKPPPPKPAPRPPRPAAKAAPERTPEEVEAVQREAAIAHHLARLDEEGRAKVEAVLAGGTVRASERHLARWAELAGRLVRIGGKVWGNPFRPWRGEGRRPTAEELAESHRRYRAHVLASPALTARLPELRGKVLACACRHGDPCHGAVLVELLDHLG